MEKLMTYVSQQTIVSGSEYDIMQQGCSSCGYIAIGEHLYEVVHINISTPHRPC